MLRRPPLRLQQLEEREVPAATMITDLHGIWGSYPLNLTPSGNTLYFTADNGHGYELYATDGTAAGVHMVKQIKPGLGGSNPLDLISADNGVIYFDADDGTGRAVWRSDGTAAGTFKVNLAAADGEIASPVLANASATVGLHGELFFTTFAPATRDLRWWSTDGTTTTLLKDFGSISSSLLNYAYLEINNGAVAFHVGIIPSPGGAAGDIWATDGTAAGTQLQQRALTGSSAAGSSQLENTKAQLAPGLFLQATLPSAPEGGIWTSNGLDSASAQLVKGFGPGSQIDGPLEQVGNEFYFLAVTPGSPFGTRQLWATDGTAAGTHQVALPTDGTGAEVYSTIPAGSKLLVWTVLPTQSLDAARLWLTDGTAAGTTEITPPAGVTGGLGQARILGRFSPGSGALAGDVVFLSGAQLWVVDPATNGTALIDSTGLPSGFQANNPYFSVDGAGRPASVGLAGDIYFNGAIYFSAANGAQHAQLWKWDMTIVSPPVVPPVVPPKVTSVVVNDGSAQRSMVTKLTVAFDRPVELADGALSLTNAAGRAMLLYFDAQTVSGHTVVTITFGGPGVLGGSLPDGRYTLTIRGANVTDAATGGAMASDSVTTFARLFGDLTGSGTFDRDARWMVHNALGQTAGQPRYIAALDVNGDGVIDATDELAVVRNWGKSV